MLILGCALLDWLRLGGGVSVLNTMICVCVSIMMVMYYGRRWAVKLLAAQTLQ